MPSVNGPRHPNAHADPPDSDDDAIPHQINFYPPTVIVPGEGTSAEQLREVFSYFYQQGIHMTQ